MSVNSEQKTLATKHLQDLRDLAATNYIAAKVLTINIILLCVIQALFGIGMLVLAFKLPNGTLWQLSALLFGVAMLAIAFPGMLHLTHVTKTNPSTAEQLQLDIHRYGLEEVPQIEEMHEKVKIN